MNAKPSFASTHACSNAANYICVVSEYKSLSAFLQLSTVALTVEAVCSAYLGVLQLLSCLWRDNTGKLSLCTAQLDLETGMSVAEMIMMFY